MQNKYLIGVLYYGAIDRAHDKCMRAVAQHPAIAQVMEMHGCPYIDIGRSALATHALEKGYGGILFIDHDMLFDPETVSLVIEDTEKTRGIVGAAYSMRRPGVEMIGGIDTNELPPGKDVYFFEGGDVFKASYLGMGFTAIHRDALETIGKDLPHLRSGITEMPLKPYFSLLQRDGNYYGEDVSFCLRAKDAGVGVYLDTRLRVWHKGTYEYGLEDSGTIVPYAKSLKAILAPTASPKHADRSNFPELQAALDAQKAEREFPTSTDPLKEAAA